MISVRNGWTGTMVILLALSVSAAVLAFAGVTPDLAAPAYALVVLLALMWAGKLFAAKVVSWKHSPLHIPVFVFVAYAVGRYWFSPLEYEARTELIGIVCCALVYFIAASNFYRARERAWFIWALLLLALVQSILGIWQFATHSNYIIPGLERPHEYANRGGGTFICPNHLAAFLEIVMALLIGRLVFFRSSSLSVQQLALRKLAFGYAALIVLAALITTLSRAGWAAAAVGVGSIIFWGGWNLRALWPRLVTLVIAIAAVATLCFSIPSVRHRLYLTFTPKDKPMTEAAIAPSPESLGGRQQLWASTVDIIRDHPAFGTGGQSWEWIHPQYRRAGIQTHPIYAHSDVLQFSSDYGIAGALLLVAVFLCFFWQVLTLAREGNSGDHRSFAIGAALATTAILIHSWFDFSMHIFANALLLSAIFGLTAAAEDNRQIFRRVEWGRFRRYALGTAVVALCAAAVWFVTPTVLGSRYTRLGDGAKEELEWDQARDYYKKAIAADPKCWQPYRNLADTCRLQAEWRDRSRIEERKQLVQEAIKNYSMAQSLNPLNADIFVGQARALEIIGENQEALKRYDRALRVDPNNAFVFDTLGRLYRNMGEPTKAAEAFKRSYELKGDEVMAWMNLEELKNPSQ